MARCSMIMMIKGSAGLLSLSDFHPVTMDDFSSIRACIQGQTYHLCDYTIGTPYIWHEYFEYRIAFIDGFFVNRVVLPGGRAAFSFPVGHGDIHTVLEKIASLAGDGVQFFSVPQQGISVLQKHFDDKLTFSFNEAWADYLYLKSDLCDLPGKKYHAKRNHFSQFQRAYPDATYEIITPDNQGMVQDFFSKYLEDMPPQSPALISEAKSIRQILPMIDTLGISGAFWQNQKQVIGFALGEVVADTLYVHIEKASREHMGAQVAICKAFTCQFMENSSIQFINREEDMGIEGLRQAKRSYHPIEMVRKLMARLG